MLEKKLEHLLKSCTLKVSGSNGHGTGFFVAPQLVLTCAHVVENDVSSGFVNIDWQEKKEPITARVEIFLRTLDIALLKIEHVTLDHPCVWMDCRVKVGDPCFSYGYPETHPHGDSTSFEYEGDGSTGKTRLLKLKGGQAESGASGSPLLNLKTGGVIGMLSISRNLNYPVGGRAIPTEILFSKLPDLVELQSEFHQPGTLWLGLIKAIPENSYGSEANFTPDKPEMLSEEIFFWDDPSLYKKSFLLLGFRSVTKRIQNIPTSLSNKDIVHIDALSKIVQRIIEERTKEGIWIIQDNQFDKLYATTSVLYFFLQLGLPIQSNLISRPLNYLESINDISINTRAKWFFNIITHRIEEKQALTFLRKLDDEQFKNRDDPSKFGSFLFFQEDDKKDINWDGRKHVYGRYFHALHIADVLLHLEERHTIARQKAVLILSRIREFLIYTLSRDGRGVIPDADDPNSINYQLTPWSYALASPLNYALPSFWIEVLQRTLVSAENLNFLRQSFVIMNVHQALFTQGGFLEDSAISLIQAQMKRYHNDLADLVLERDDFNVRDLSIIGRALIYSASIQDIHSHCAIMSYITSHFVDS